MGQDGIQHIDPSGCSYGHEECGVQVLVMEVLLDVILLYLPPHLLYCVPFGPVPQKAHDIPVYATLVSRVTINM